MVNKKNEQPCDKNRRTILKTAAATIGTAYIAPSTLNLLMAKRASAQSAVRFTFINDTGGLTYQVTWEGHPVTTVGPGTSTTQPNDVSNNMLFTFSCAPTPYNISVNGDVCTSANPGGSPTIQELIDEYGSTARLVDCVPMSPGSGDNLLTI